MRSFVAIAIALVCVPLLAYLCAPNTITRIVAADANCASRVLGLEPALVDVATFEARVKNLALEVHPDAHQGGASDAALAYAKMQQAVGELTLGPQRALERCFEGVPALLTAHVGCNGHACGAAA